MSNDRLWGQRRSHIVFCLLINAIAVVSTVAAAIAVPITATDLRIAAALTAFGVVEAELARPIERIRLRPDRAVHINMTSTWTLPALLLVSPPLVGALVAGLHWHLYLRGWYRQKAVPRFRTWNGAVVMILVCYAVRAVLEALGVDGIRDAIDLGWVGFVDVVLAIGSYVVINTMLVMIARVTLGRDIRSLLGSLRSGVLLELGTLVLGAMLAVIIVTQPGLSVLMILPVFLLHRAVLVAQFESAAQQDTKTNVLNMAGWHRSANHELARNGAMFGVLMIDLDHFKLINDRYGHLAGDAVLKAVADTIKVTVRREDIVGRFGGEEFVVLLHGMPAREVHEVAERIRIAISKLEITIPAGDLICGLSASIGFATGPGSGTAIEPLLLAADAAVYRAKGNGRNRVEGGPD